jgi:hypothetical protein
MSKTVKKIKAFTLQEMLVVLLITALVVGMAFSVLRLVQVQMHGITSNYEKNTEQRLLYQRLWMDFNAHDRIWYQNRDRALLLVNEINEINYRFHEDMVIRELDTFYVEVFELNPYFGTVSIDKGEIDAIDLFIGKESQTRLFMYKRNAATSYINR